MVSIVDGFDSSHEEKPSMALSTKDASLSSLYLPHMPPIVSASSPPAIRLLVCSDVDLQSSSALCEFLLEQRNELFDPTTIDMVLVSGPLTSESVFGSFGSQYRSRNRFSRDSVSTALAQPFMESPESAAARLGMITACLSQLENVVCRVLYLMGATDPLLVPPTSGAAVAEDSAERQQHRPRLTPNSRDLNHQWLGIAPGLGCAGLNYIEGLDWLLDELRDHVKNDNENEDEKHNTLDDSESTSRAAASILAQRVGHLPDACVFDRCISNYMETAHFFLPYFSCTKQSYSEAVGGLLQLTEPQRPLAEHRPLPTATNEPCWPSGSQTILATQYTRTRDMGDIPERRPASGSSDDPRVCFEIATGVVTDKNNEQGDHAARWITPRRLLYPGSLRERGDFVLVDVALCKKDGDDGAVFRWEVIRSQFHTLNNFR